MTRAASIDDYRLLAKQRLPHFLFEYYDGGANAEVTLGRNVSDLADIALHQRVLCGVDQVDLSTTLFDEKLALPVILAPIGLGGMAARRGEVQAVRAAQYAGVPFTLSTVSACPLAEVAAAAARPLWFQLYMIRDRAFMERLIDSAEAAGCSALVFTVDMPVPGTRYRDLRSGLSGSPGIGGQLRRGWQALKRPHWAWDVGAMGRPHQLGNVAPVLGKNSGMEDFLGWLRANFDPTVTWADLDWLRRRWRGPIIVKGILHPDDARAAADHGADGIIVSNHGGRQLDSVLSAARALPAIAEAVGDRLTVLADGGVRSGLDVVKLMALGARGVMIGRPWIFALGAAGEAGVTHVLQLLATEMRVAMMLTGHRTVASIGRAALADG